MIVSLFATLLALAVAFLGLAVASEDKPLVGIGGIIMMVTGAYSLNEGVSTVVVTNQTTINYVSATQGSFSPFGVILVAIGAAFLIMAASPERGG